MLFFVVAIAFSFSEAVLVRVCPSEKYLFWAVCEPDAWFLSMFLYSFVSFIGYNYVRYLGLKERQTDREGRNILQMIIFNHEQIQIKIKRITNNN